MANYFDNVNVPNDQALSNYEQSFSAFSGSDIVAYVNHQRVGTLQGITISVTREVVPIYVFGDPNPKAFPKGKRAIAGNLVFTQFDRHAILKMGNRYSGKNFIGQMDYFNAPDGYINNGTGAPVKMQYAGGYDQLTKGSSQLGATPMTNPNSNMAPRDKMMQAIAEDLAETYALVATRRFKYSDQVPLMDITITMVNEMGQAAYMAVHGVQLVNEGTGYTLDDINHEAAFTFVARGITPLDSIKSGNSGQQLVYANDQNDKWVGNVAEH